MRSGDPYPQPRGTPRGALGPGQCDGLSLCERTATGLLRARSQPTGREITNALVGTDVHAARTDTRQIMCLKEESVSDQVRQP